MADGFGVAAISAWEVAMLAEKGRIELDKDSLLWLRHATTLPRVQFLELTVEIAARAASYPREVGGDPADRLIIATTVEYGAQLVTKDGLIRRAGLVKTIW
jgi:PIN domain nuclease of toxin-antitoxin system